MRRRQGSSSFRAGSSQVDTPREVVMPWARRLRSMAGSNVHRSRPVSGSRAITRLRGVETYNVPPTMMGVASNAVPARSMPSSLLSPVR